MKVICIISTDLGSQQWSLKTLASLLDKSKWPANGQFAQTKNDNSQQQHVLFELTI